MKLDNLLLLDSAKIFIRPVKVLLTLSLELDLSGKSAIPSALQSLCVVFTTLNLKSIRPGTLK